MEKEGWRMKGKLEHVMATVNSTGRLSLPQAGK